MSPIPTLLPTAAALTPRSPSHPLGLYVLSAAEAFERFGFYLMLPMFALYLNEQHGFSTAQAASWYGSYLSVVYFSPLFGGWLGSRLIQRQAWVTLGGLLLAIGYLILASGTMASLIPALSVLALGNGLFKPNISTLVGGLYAPSDPRRDEAFGIFYVSVNIGAMLGPLAGGLLRVHYGYPGAFVAAAVGLLLSALVLRLWRRHLTSYAGTEPEPRAAASTRPKSSNQRRVAALLLVVVMVVPFWMAYFQSGSTLTFFARDNVNRMIPWLGQGHYELAPESFTSMCGFFVLLLTMPLARSMRWFRRRGVNLTSADKIVAGLACAGLAYALLCGVVTVDGDRPVHMGWLVAFYFVLTLAELLLSPVGLSLVTKLSPPRWVGLLMGVWFLAASGGSKLAGQIGELWTTWGQSRFFGSLGLLLLGTATLLATQLGWLRKTLPRENG